MPSTGPTTMTLAPCSIMASICCCCWGTLLSAAWIRAVKPGGLKLLGEHDLGLLPVLGAEPRQRDADGGVGGEALAAGAGRGGGLPEVVGSVVPSRPPPQAVSAREVTRRPVRMPAAFNFMGVSFRKIPTGRSGSGVGIDARSRTRLGALGRRGAAGAPLGGLGVDYLVWVVGMVSAASTAVPVSTGTAGSEVDAGSLRKFRIRRADQGRAALLLVVDIEGDGGQEHEALDDLRLVGADAHQHEAAVEDRHHEATDHRADDGADAAGDRGATDEDGRDGVELPHGAVGGAGGGGAARRTGCRRWPRGSDMLSMTRK